MERIFGISCGPKFDGCIMKNNRRKYTKYQVLINNQLVANCETEKDARMFLEGAGCSVEYFMDDIIKALGGQAGK